MNSIKLGIIGKNIKYTFSKQYFRNFFIKNNIKNIKYYIFNIKNIKKFFNIKKKINNFKGLNITIPYKKKIIKYLYKINITAKKIKSINLIKIVNNKLIGYNTDYYGFFKSLYIKKKYKKVLILGGSGGVGNSIIYILNKLNLNYNIITRKFINNKIYKLYNNLKKKDFNNSIIINCTPIGTFPFIDKKPYIKYCYLNNNNYLYDLIYNPLLTNFLKEGLKKKCYIQNGIKMLFFQANKSWKIWNKF
ncbi:MAG: shikimate dehydrogenase family protein [Candidatus Shikimatogenerans sp. Tduv]|uniref:Shikimate dehydrogenase n=1 Tax=Candidatus Shikimatogenerans sp. Tduv TaxID=3158567 RepID=A0AAU7QSX8_9FLAO